MGGVPTLVYTDFPVPGGHLGKLPVVCLGEPSSFHRIPITGILKGGPVSERNRTSKHILTFVDLKLF